MSYLFQDAKLKVTKALPSSGTSEVASDGIDLKMTARGDAPGNCELLLSAGAMATGVLGDGDTVKYTVYHDSAVGFGSEEVLHQDLLIQTGASAAGASAATARMRLPTDVKRYIRVKGDPSVSTNKSGTSFTAALVF